MREQRYSTQERQNEQACHQGGNWRHFSLPVFAGWLAAAATTSIGEEILLCEASHRNAPKCSWGGIELQI